MQIHFSDQIILDSRKAVWMAPYKTLVLADFFMGLGATWRKHWDPAVPLAPKQEIWERLFSLLSDYQPECIALLGDIKPNQGHLDGEEAEELRLIFKKLQGSNRQVIQVVGSAERSHGPALEGTGIHPLELHPVGPYKLMHRRRMFVYPRVDHPQGFWINGGVHPLFVVPNIGPAGMDDWLRLSAFLHTGFALVMPPFVHYAQGFEVMQSNRLPRQAKAWTLLGDRLSPLDLQNLPPAPEHLKAITRSLNKGREKRAPIGPIGPIEEAEATSS